MPAFPKTPKEIIPTLLFTAGVLGFGLYVTRKEEVEDRASLRNDPTDWKKQLNQPASAEPNVTNVYYRDVIGQGIPGKEYNPNMEPMKKA
ncbi:hypothetical protein HDU98_010111 [Podochytrium sp. JEL0797]|nr:hypothetical protein HDU98_010111 [Podochytrium sp. JEL0797]